MLSVLHHINPLRGASRVVNAVVSSHCNNGGNQPHLAAPLGSIRGIAKYARNGPWSRGKDGLHTTRDPRIFRHLLRRKYPFFKERKWSKPYIGKDFTAPTDFGSALQLAIYYRGWKDAKVYYQLRHLLQAMMPAAHIVGEVHEVAEGSPQLRVMRLNDNRHLADFTADEVQQFEGLEDKFAMLVNRASDNLHWRYFDDASDVVHRAR
mmetsp:Transcript_29080/g.52994  ORF Transcript_29080/g.52994 Transcript_29080/m.52994 type:complete len:207 (-) Transcript_29080:11-631(-)